MRELQKAGDNNYKRGTAYLELARLYKFHGEVPEAITHYISAAQSFRTSREFQVQAATLFEEAEELCFHIDNLRLGVECLTLSFECFQNIGWEDRCNAILERIVALGRNDIAEELSKRNIWHKAEILRIQTRDVKKQIKKNKLQVPNIMDMNIVKAENHIRNGDNNSAIIILEEAKRIGEELLNDRKDALEKMRVLEGNIREMDMDEHEDISKLIASSKSALGDCKFKEAKALSESALDKAREIIRIREEEKRLAEEREREEENKRRLEENRKREEEERKRGEQEEQERKRAIIMEKLREMETGDANHKLSIKILQQKEFRKGIWSDLEIQLKNEGITDIYSIRVSIVGSTVQSRGNRVQYLSIGEPENLKLSIKPMEIGDSVPMEIIVTAKDMEGNEITFPENYMDIKVTDRIIEKTPEKVEINITSSGDMAIGGQVVKDSMQYKSNFQDGSSLESLLMGALKGHMDPEERYAPYKEALRKRHMGKIDESYMDSIKDKLKITQKEHENLESEVRKEMETKSKGELLF